MWNIFRTCGRDDQQGGVAGSIIAEKFKGKRIAMVHDKTTYGQGLADETRKTMNAKGLKEVLYEGVNVGDKDYSALVSKIKAARADLVYWGGLHDTGGLILRQMRDQGVKATTFMGGDGITDDEFAAIAGPGAEGTLMTFSPDPRTNPANKQIVEVFRKKGFEPQAYTLYSYAAVQVIKQAAETGKVARSQESRRGDAFRQGLQHRAGRPLLRQEGRRDGLHRRGQEEGPLRPLRLEERPRRQDHLCRGRVVRDGNHRLRGVWRIRHVRF